MSAVLEATPAGTQAAMIEAVLSHQHQRIALPTVASNFNITLADLQAILKRHGYPDNDRMRRAAAALRAEAVERADREETDAALTVVDDAPAEARPRMVKVAVKDLIPDPDNLREHTAAPIPELERNSGNGSNHAEDDVEQLAESIKEVGLLQPIVARRDGDRLVVVAGHRRLAAIKRLRWTHVDVIVRAPMRPDHVIAAMLIENGQRRDLDPIEEARGITRLKAEHDLTDLAVAKKIGRSQAYVSGRLALLALTHDQQDAVRRKALGITEATNLGRLQAGNTRHSAKGHISVAYFGPTNELAPKAAARCNRLGHKGKIAGGVACGACWESILRADERTEIEKRNATADDCVSCGAPLDHRTAATS
jgi:ParB family chromosome partitioning protein